MEKLFRLLLDGESWIVCSLFPAGDEE